jgi:hypothetical protein
MDTKRNEHKMRPFYWPWLVLIGVLAVSIGVGVALIVG